MKENDERLPNLLNTDRNKLKSTEWMKRDWNARADIDIKYFIRSAFNQTEEEFWESGYHAKDTKILIPNSLTYNYIFKKQNPKQMNVLEIGCGIGRIMVPMSKIFHHVTGIDISEKIVGVGKKYLKSVPNCKVLLNNGNDLSEFPNDCFDFCYSHLVFQHIPDKEIVINYIKEVSRVIKEEALFRFQVNGNTDFCPPEFNTWHGITFSQDEIHKLAKENHFDILEESLSKQQYYLITFKKI